MRRVIIKTEELRKKFLVGNQEVEVLKGVNLNIYEGDFVIIFGPSGCGKSTLLHTLLGLEEPTIGKVLVEDHDFYLWNEDERANYRKCRISTMFQQPLWIRSLSVIENVAFPWRLLGYGINESLQRAKEMLISVGMDGWADHLPMELSAGQQQKTSLARSLIINPLILAADEPTGNLDTKSGEDLMVTLLKLNASGRTIIMITHDLEYLKYGTKLIHMIDGEIVEEYNQEYQKKNGVNEGKKYMHGKGNLDVHDPDFIKKLHTEK